MQSENITKTATTTFLRCNSFIIMKSFIGHLALCLLGLELAKSNCAATRSGIFKPVFVLDSDFSVQATLKNIQNQMVCQVHTNILNMPAYHFNSGTSECKLGNVSATLPSIAKHEPGQLTVWATQDSLPQTEVLHVMALVQHSGYREVEDYSFDKALSRPLQNSVQWIPNSLGLGTMSYWKYRGGVVFCGNIECYLKSRDDQPAKWFANLTKSAVYRGGYGYLNGKPWTFGGYNSWDPDKYGIKTSEILEPWGEWVLGPALPSNIVGGSKGCVEDIGNSTMLIAGTSTGWDYWLYNWDTDEWVKTNNYLSLRIQATSCTKITHPTTGRKLIIMPGGRTKLNGEYVGVNKVFLFDIETRTWSEDGPPLPVELHGGITLGPDDGLDTVYRVSSGNSVLRLREDFSGWDSYPQWGGIGDGLPGQIPIPMIYTN